MEIKRGFFFVILLVLIFNLLGCCSALGIWPAKTKINFQPNYDFSVEYHVVGVPPDERLEAYADGDLADYVEFSKTNLMGEDSFSVNVILPSEAEKPGENELFIGVRQVKEEGVGIGTLTSVEALILVNVPYPGKYAEIKSFSINNANVGEPVTAILSVASLGKEGIAINPSVEVYSDEELIETLFFGSELMESQTTRDFSKQLSKEYLQGDYRAIAVVEYSENVLKMETNFKIGDLFVDITNYTSELIKGKINPFYIEIESKWNNPLEEIHAEVNLTDLTGESVGFFKTPSVSLKPWSKTTLEGFINTESINIGDYKANIDLFYNGKESGEVFDVSVVSKGFLWVMKNNILIVLIVMLLIIILTMIYLFWRKHGKKASKINRKK